MQGQCEFCGKEKEVGETTPFHGSYCKECMQMNIDYDRESIKKMKPTKRKKMTEEELEKLRQEKDAAFAKLMNYDS